MLGPTPDWFIGVNGLDLRDTGGGGGSTNGWLNTVVVDLFTYDGGSRTEDENFALFGTLESPQKAIELLTDTPVVTNPDRTALNGMLIGRFTFELQSVVASSASQGSAEVSPDLEQPAAILVNPFAQRSFNDATVLDSWDSPLVSATFARAPSTQLSSMGSAAAPANASKPTAMLDLRVASDTQESSQEVVGVALLELLDEQPSDGLL